jgi:dTDP-4-dehydrorhamnose 3,5-epimerase
MIEGVVVKKLKVVSDERGRLQVYLTTAYENVVKDRDGFHMHKNQTDSFCCVKGRIKVVLVDTRDQSPTKGAIDEFEIGEGNFCRLTIPKKVLHAFKSLQGESIIINTIDHEYNHAEPDEFRIKNDYYNWDKMCPLKKEGVK